MSSSAVAWPFSSTCAGARAEKKFCGDLLQGSSRSRMAPRVPPIASTHGSRDSTPSHLPPLFSGQPWPSGLAATGTGAGGHCRNLTHENPDQTGGRVGRGCVAAGARPALEYKLACRRCAIVAMIFPDLISVCTQSSCKLTTE